MNIKLYKLDKILHLFFEIELHSEIEMILGIIIITWENIITCLPNKRIFFSHSHTFLLGYAVKWSIIGP